MEPERSGQKTWIHWRWQCSTFLRQTFVEWAAQTINKSYWAGLFYAQQRAKGCSYQAAVRALAFKWIRILYRCWTTRTPYDEAKCRFGDNYSFAIGGENVFDTFPGDEQDGVLQFLGVVGSVTSPFGFNGGHWYARLTVDF